MTTAAFKQQLAIGHMAETDIARWLRGRGFHILPAYEKVIDNGKGPQFFAATGQSYATPDLLCMKEHTILWAEAKYKTTFTWYRKTKAWQDGIDKNHFEQYCAIADTVPHAIYLFFLHKDTWHEVACYQAPEPSETGLFVAALDKLRKPENYRADDRWGRHGMVYWNKELLTKVAELQEVVECHAN